MADSTTRKFALGTPVRFAGEDRTQATGVVVGFADWAVFPHIPEAKFTAGYVVRLDQSRWAIVPSRPERHDMHISMIVAHEDSLYGVEEWS